jgi:hypothetical protein
MVQNPKKKITVRIEAWSEDYFMQRRKGAQRIHKTMANRHPCATRSYCPGENPNGQELFHAKAQKERKEYIRRCESAPLCDNIVLRRQNPNGQELFHAKTQRRKGAQGIHKIIGPLGPHCLSVNWTCRQGSDDQIIP